MTTREEEFVKTAEAIASYVKENTGNDDGNDTALADSDVAREFITRATGTKKNLQEISDEGRDLVIGIVGCVKAGKSSFLNALVFDGKETLPKAATPMTAALSRIKYSEEPYAEITFYSSDDWTNIQNQAAEYDKRIDEEFEKQKNENTPESEGPDSGIGSAQRTRKLPRLSRKNKPKKSVTREQVEAFFGPTLPEELRSCHELVKLAQDAHVNVTDHLGGKERISLPQDGNYMQAIENYVGAGGQYTPIVNYIELGINEPALDGLVVVDTPGLNDPIVSRGRTTEKFLKDADIVFVASSVSQFLPETDVQLLKEQLHRNNIHRASIVGTQLDSGVLQYPRNKGASFKDALRGSIQQYTKQATDITTRLAAGSQSVLLKRLAETQPVFVSAMMYSIGKKLEQGEALSEDEKHILTQMKQRFPEYDQLMDGPDSYFVFSRIPSVKEKFFEPARQQKEETIRERLESFTDNQSAELARLLEQVGVSARTQKHSLETSDAAQLERKLRDLRDNLNSIRSQIVALFQNQGSSYARAVQGIKIEIAREMSRHKGISVTTENEEHSEEYSTGLFGWSKQKRFWTEQVDVGNTNDVVEHVIEYSTEAQKIINDNLEHLVDIPGLKRRIKECVVGAFDLADRKFDEQEILGPIDSLLNNLTFTQVSFDYTEEAENQIDAAFGGQKRVRGNEEVARLKSFETTALNNALQRLSQKLDSASADAQAKMNREAATFVDKIEARIAQNVETIRAQLDNKKENIRRYDEFISRIDAFKSQLLDFRG